MILIIITSLILYIIGAMFTTGYVWSKSYKTFCEEHPSLSAHQDYNNLNYESYPDCYWWGALFPVYFLLNFLCLFLVYTTKLIHLILKPFASLSPLKLGMKLGGFKKEESFIKTRVADEEKELLKSADKEVEEILSDSEAYKKLTITGIQCNE